MAIYPRTQFSAVTTHQNDHRLQATNDKLGRPEASSNQRLGGFDDKPPEQIEPTPWYLQVETPKRHLQSLGDHQILPELPEDSPPLLEPLLEQVSSELGMDDIALLDLRNLDPPPALGANLVMLLATARSEKHLHVSADRLCRWLRSSYNLKPFADGLLGRNELKLKMRRKARRAKLFSNVGVNEPEPEDDGIRTGWVCVNIGPVKAASPLRSGPIDPPIVGFGGAIGQVRIVIQLLTEKKREEMDLEGLWGALSGRDKDYGEASSATHAPESQADSDRSSGVDNYTQERVSTLKLNAHGRMGQVRRFHGTSRISLNQEVVYHPPRATRNGSKSWGETYGDLMGSPGLLKQEADSTLWPNLKMSISDNLQSAGFHSFLETLRCLPMKNRDKASLVASLLKEEEVKPGLHPLFLTLLQVHTRFPDNEQWRARFRWLCRVVEVANIKRLGAISPNHLRSLETFQSLGPERSFSTILYSGLGLTDNVPGTSDSLIQEEMLDNDKNIVLAVLETMSYQLPEIMNEETFFYLLKAIVPSLASRATAYQNPIASYFKVSNSPEVPILMEISDLMEMFGVSFQHEHMLAQVLQLYANQGLWGTFWDAWNTVARERRARSTTLYEVMYESLANTKHQSACCEALRIWFPEMGNEGPPVVLEGRLLNAIRSCVLIADPDVEHKLKDDHLARGEWTGVWRICEKADCRP